METENLEDNPGSGRPLTANTEENVLTVFTLW